MNNTRISTEAGTALLAAYTKHPCMLELGLSIDEIGIGNFEALRQVRRPDAQPAPRRHRQ